MNRIYHCLAAALVQSLAFTGAAWADVRPHVLVSDGMVLQRDEKANVWGTADPGEKVAVSFRDQGVLTTTGADGKWLAAVPAGAAGGPFPLTIAGKNTVTLKSVLVGEVWVCAGQSNMEYALIHCTGGEEAIAASANPMLHLFTVPHNSQDEPRADLPSGGWVESGPKATRNFSAVGYWFGSKLQKELGVPVGLINSSYGGTNIEAWIGRRVLEGVPGKDRYADFDAMRAEYDAAVAKEKPARDAYAKAVAEAKTQGKPAPLQPHFTGPWRGPSAEYNGMVAPLLNYRIRGVAWYQGESNSYVGRANTYQVLFPALIREWRADWGEGDFPFLFVQITPNRKREPDANVPSGIAVVREAQRLTLASEPKCAMVVTTDLGDEDGDVHYKRKEPTGERLMLAALAVAYGRDVEYSGPLYERMSVEGDNAVIRFTHLGGGLVARGGALTGFTLAGEDRKFTVAEARIEGDTVVVTSAAVPRPVAVRYGWAEFPTVNLWNKAGLPASPFRTDEFPLPAR